MLAQLRDELTRRAASDSASGVELVIVVREVAELRRTAGPTAEVVLQDLPNGAQRLWRVDTLLADQPISACTPATEAGLAWYRAEWG
jgi:hypothetical protein